MKKILVLIVLAFTYGITGYSQEPKTVVLEQTKGEFTVKEMHLSAGDYIFEIVNSGVDHEVGFVLAPEGKTDAKDHIQSAYVKETVASGKSSMSSLVSLEKGTYVYFCPLNPTPQYKLVVN